MEGACICSVVAYILCLTWVDPFLHAVLVFDSFVSCRPPLLSASYNKHAFITYCTKTASKTGTSSSDHLHQIGHILQLTAIIDQLKGFTAKSYKDATHDDIMVIWVKGTS